MVSISDKETTDNSKKSWYFDDISDLEGDVRRFFENYCHLAPEDVIPHIKAVVGSDFSPYLHVIPF